jgi:GNAT superfamily N-acetyltransferase
VPGGGRILRAVTGFAKSSFEIRAAQASDAAAICDVVRRSIIQLCVRDHQNDPAWLDEWLANKTVENFAGWIADPENRMFVAVADRTILAAGCFRTTGDITLNYVSPAGRFQGISRAMLRRLEQVARELGHRRVALTSTITAHDFYLAAGYSDCERGDWPRMEKTLEDYA